MKAAITTLILAIACNCACWAQLTVEECYSKAQANYPLIRQRGLIEKTKDYKHLAGPKKIYLNNANLMYALSGRISEGTLRETCFANQVGAIAPLTMPKQGDFLADGKYLFEVGGSRKTFNQIANFPNSYLAIDDIETGNGNRIPLWMFGCLY